jgi:hypothetical protein
VPSLPPSTSRIDASEIVLECLPEIAKGALVVAAVSTAPPVAIVGAFVTGYDAAQCLASEYAEAEAAETIRRAIEDCTLGGGVPVTAGDVTTCIEFVSEP